MTTNIERPSFDAHGAAAAAVARDPRQAAGEGRLRFTFVTAARCMRSYLLATHTGAELDLLLIKGSRRYGVEVKFQGAPRVTPSMRIALADLQLHHLTVLYPGDQRYALDPYITVAPLADLASDPGVITPTTRGHRP